MQTAGYLLVNGEKIFVLARRSKYLIFLKLRQGGRDGVYFEGESAYLSENADTLDRLKSGETIGI